MVTVGLLVGLISPTRTSVATSAVVARSACTIRGTPGADVLVGTPGRDVICAGGGADTVNGMGGSDIIRGGGGSDFRGAGLSRGLIRYSAPVAPDRLGDDPAPRPVERLGLAVGGG